MAANIAEQGGKARPVCKFIVPRANGNNMTFTQDGHIDHAGKAEKCKQTKLNCNKLTQHKDCPQMQSLKLKKPTTFK